MSLQHWLLLVLLPVALGVVVFVFRHRLRAQIASILLGIVVHAALLVLLEIVPGNGFSQHGNTWQGYALIELGPFVLVLGVVLGVRSLRPLKAEVSPAVVAVLVPLSYWVGLFIAISVAVTAGLASP